MKNIEFEQFTAETLRKILREFANNRKLFCSESQFQYDLGRKIEDETCATVMYEVPHNNDDGKRKYIDIVVDFGDNRKIAIELKYKAPNGLVVEGAGLNGEDIHVPKQGAVDEGSYFYLKDVERLERIIKGKDNIKAFALILASSSISNRVTTRYWGKSDRDHVWKSFSLEDGRTINHGVSLKWGQGLREGWDSIELRSDYNIKWIDYLNNEKVDVKYLILEIKN